MDTIQEFLEKRIHLAFEVVPLSPQAKMALHNLRPAYISSQIKITQGLKCETVEDYLTKPLKIDFFVQNRCLGEILNMKSKEDYIQLVQEKMKEFWGIDLSDDERIAHHMYTELLVMPFLQMANNHIASLK